MTRLLAVRHGETEWNREGRVQGWAPVGLTERGRTGVRELASDLAARLGDGGSDGTETATDRLVTSDLQRTRETASILVEGSSLPAPEPDRAFRERGLGVYQGLRVPDLAKRHPEISELGSVTALSVTPEGGESLADLAERVRGGVETLRENCGPDDTVVLVTHGGPIRVLLADARGVTLEESIREHAPANCSVFEFALGEAGLRFVEESREG